ncbi:hypothetical protein OSB04_018217 [Centaurea solstitialis]|uniref:Agenet domain-containing protein n=1 Tax=Centaurea solstitialis TaxID=347529 RepID=A0AA38TMF6_9ASTR|nr:hypothetical protein OSB04_018217 [Centaurea solstitialis]
MVIPITKGSLVEVSSDDPGFHGAWYVATFLDEVVLQQDQDHQSSSSKGSNHKTKNSKKIGYRVKYVSIAEEGNLDERLTEIVDPSFVRPSPPRYPRGSISTNNDQAEYYYCYEVFEVVDAYLLDGWWMGVVTKVVDNGDKYMVWFEFPPEQVEVKRSNLRLHVDWIDGRWQIPPKKTPVPAQETQESAITKAEHQDPLLLEQEMSITETCETVAGKSSRKRKRALSVRALFNVESCNAYIQESGKRASSAIVEMTTGLDEQPLSAWYHGVLKKTRKLANSFRSKAFVFLAPLYIWFRSLGGIYWAKFDLVDLILVLVCILIAGSRRSACDHGVEPSDSLIPAVINNREMTEYQQGWPFIKRSPIWAAIESLELYQNPPQKPHFSLLKEVKEDRREGLAIAHLVTFANVVERTSELKWDDPDDMILNSLESLVELETHGFDVGAIRARLNELLSRKAQAGELQDKVKQMDKDLQERNLEMSKIDEELGELKGKMQDLKEKLAESAKKKNVKDEEIKTLQSNVRLFANQIGLEGYFEKTCS